MKISRIVFVACALGTLWLGGCAQRADYVRPCPAIVLVPDAAFLTRFAGTSEELNDILFEAEAGIVQPTVCYYIEDSDGAPTTIRSEIKLKFAASRGPKNQDGLAKFNYWVRVTGPNQARLSTQTLDVEIPFTAAKVQNVVGDEIEILTPLKSGENGDFYQIWIGIELTPAELAYNRKNPRQ